MIKLLFFYSLICSQKPNEKFLEEVFYPKKSTYMVAIPYYSKPGQKEVLITTNMDFYEFNKNNENFAEDTIAYLQYIKDIFKGKVKLDLPKALYDDLYHGNFLIRKNKFLNEALRNRQHFIDKYSYKVAAGRKLSDPLYADDNPYIIAAFFELNFFIVSVQNGYYLKEAVK